MELYNEANKALFWGAELPYFFNVGLWSDSRVSQALRLAIQYSPDHLTKATELPVAD